VKYFDSKVKKTCGRKKYIMLVLPLVSILIAFVASIFGIGGGILLFPVLVFFGIPVHQAVSVTVAGAFITSLSSTIVYIGKKKTNIKLALKLEIIAVPASLLGAYAFINFDEGVIKTTYGVVMLIVGLIMLVNFTPKEPKKYRKVPLIKLPILYPIIGIAGFVAGFLGIGGGSIKGPALIATEGMEAKKAAATSSLMVVVTLFFALIAHLFVSVIPFDLLLETVPFLFIGAQIGARIQGKLKSRDIKIGFGFILLAVALQLLFF